jgi:hypothetical protein
MVIEPGSRRSSRRRNGLRSLPAERDRQMIHEGAHPGRRVWSIGNDGVSFHRFEGVLGQRSSQVSDANSSRHTQTAATAMPSPALTHAAFGRLGTNAPPVDAFMADRLSLMEVCRGGLRLASVAAGPWRGLRALPLI